MELFSSWAARLPAKIFYGLARFFFLAGIVMFSASLRADAPQTSRRETPPGCFCDCPASHQRTGCAKMCDVRRRAARAWTVTCHPKRIINPAPNHEAKPSLRRSPRFEHASLHSSDSVLIPVRLQ